MSLQLGTWSIPEEDVVVFRNSECSARGGDEVSDSGSTVSGSDRGSLDEELLDRPAEGAAPDFGPRRFSTAETLTIFDWDDTLLPTSWIEAEGLLEGDGVPVLSQEQRMTLELLSERVADTLAEAQSFGNVCIITNAVEGWVEASCELFMPSLYGIVKELPIFSARSAFEPQGVLSPAQWKVMAFEQEVSRFCRSLQPGQTANIVSVGDSDHEYKGTLSATASRSSCVSKCLKLVERPSAWRLIEEHELIAGAFEEVAQYGDDLDVDVGGCVE